MSYLSSINVWTILRDQNELIEWNNVCVVTELKFKFDNRISTIFVSSVSRNQYVVTFTHTTLLT